jgi:transposase
VRHGQLYDRVHDPLIEAACWAHIRRKFFDIQAAHDSRVARESLERIGALYTIETEIRARRLSHVWRLAAETV